MRNEATLSPLGDVVRLSLPSLSADIHNHTSSARKKLQYGTSLHTFYIVWYLEAFS